MPHPPKYPTRFLRWYCREDYLDEIEGDLVELFEKRSEHSRSKANWRFVWDVMRSFRPVNFKKLKNNNYMWTSIQNYTRVYFRMLRKQTIHYLVNILGMALGLMVFLFIYLYVYDEWHIDHYHANGDRIYRVLEERKGEDGALEHYSATSNMLAVGLKDEFPEIEETARMMYFGSGGLRKGTISFTDRNYAFSTPSVFKILDINITQGDPYQSYNGPIAAVLNQSTARKLFGDENPVGQTVDLPGKINGVEVIAVYEDIPINSTYRFNTIYVCDFAKFPINRDWLNSWNSRGMLTWALFKEGASPDQVMAKKKGFLEKYFDEESRPYHDFYFQSIRDIHLGSSHLDTWGSELLLSTPYGQMQFVRILFLISIFVILIASLNYINLSSVQALKRSLEAGIRKVNGATSGQLRLQVFVETVLTLVIANVLMFGLVFLLFPSFKELSGKEVEFIQIFQPDFLIYQIILILAIGVLSSIIPAIYYSKYTRNLGSLGKRFQGKGDVLRKTFVVVQYSISLVLIISSMIFYHQLSYVKDKNLGFSYDKLLTLDINSSAARINANQIINTLKEDANIANASASSRVPGEWKWIPTVSLSLEKNGTTTASTHYAVDHNWFDTYDIELLYGNNFSGLNTSDTLKVILNEEAVQAMGLEDPIGQMIWVSEDTISRMEIIGVVKNFHFKSLYEPLGPAVITGPNNPIISIDYFTIKYINDPMEAYSQIEKAQAMFDPETPAEINFLDERWERYYVADNNRGNLIFVATLISILISSFGLFGLINFTVERKTKEVGIRKVLGASINNVIKIILSDYVVLLLIAFLIASPLSWWALTEWLSGFAYRVEVTPLVFFIALLIVMAISFLTVLSRVYRLAKSNPVNSLRYE
jgi:putative ABC transport system permease protein